MHRRSLIFIAASLLIAWTATIAWPKSVKMIGMKEMIAAVPEFTFSSPSIELDSDRKKAVERASDDASKSGFPCSYWKAVHCPKSDCVLFIFTIKGVTDTHLIYRAAGARYRLMDKCMINMFGRWLPPD